MSMPVVIKASGGMPVTVVTHAYGVPMIEATNGIGRAVTEATNGAGLGVTGITFGPDVTAPTITSSNTVSNVENTVLAHTLTANETVTWAKVGGADTARFEISGNTLRWLSNGVKDFEAPNDADTNNTYVVQVQATDTALNASTVQTITVTVTNVAGTAPDAPVLALTSSASDNTPDFELTGDLVLGDTVRFQYSTASDFTGASETTNTIDAGEDAANEISFSTGALANNTWYFRARIERPDAEGTGISGWSNTETVTISVVSSTTTWNPSDKTAGITLSGGNLVTTTAIAAAGNTIRAIASASSGKYYWEITQTNSFTPTPDGAQSECVWGILNTSQSLVGDYVVGFGTETAGLYNASQIRVNGVFVGDAGFSLADGNICSIALDLDNLKIWFRLNGSGWNNDVIGNQNPATNTGGVDISAVDRPVHAAITYENAQVDTTNFGATAYAYTPPAGFGNW